MRRSERAMGMLMLAERPPAGGGDARTAVPASRAEPDSASASQLKSGASLRHQPKRRK
jgi:hypothetical protein